MAVMSGRRRLDGRVRAAVVGAATGLLVAAVSSAQTAPELSLLRNGAMDVRWVTPPDAPLAAKPAFDSDTAYAPTLDGALVARDLESGAVRWRVATAATLPPAVGDGLVFVVDASSVRAYAAPSGALRWQHALPDKVVASPYWETGWLILSLENGDLAALRAVDGHQVWRVALGAAAAVAPAPALDNLYLALSDGRAVALALATGATVWSRQLEGNGRGVAAREDQVVVGTSAGVVWSLDPRSGRVRWRYRTGAGVVAAVAIDDARIYVLAYDHLLRALDRRRGQLRWRRALPHRPAGAPLVIGGTVLVPSFAAELAGYDAVTGAPTLSMTATSEVAGATAFRVGGPATGTRITALTTDGQLIAFGPRIEGAPVPLADPPGTPSPEPATPPQLPAAGGRLLR